MCSVPPDHGQGLADKKELNSTQDDANFEEDGIRIEPFNLKQEREEGYFDENGNFVEYASQHEIKVLDFIVIIFMRPY